MTASSSSSLRATRAVLSGMATAAPAAAAAAAGVEELIVLEQIDGPPPGGRENVGQGGKLLIFRLGEELVCRRIDHAVGLADADDGRRLDGHLDGSGPAAGVQVGGLIRDLDVDVDRLTPE